MADDVHLECSILAERLRRLLQLPFGLRLEIRLAGGKVDAVSSRVKKERTAQTCMLLIRSARPSRVRRWKCKGMPDESFSLSNCPNALSDCTGNAPRFLLERHHGHQERSDHKRSDAITRTRAALLDFDSSGRIEGSYYVELRTPAQWEALPPSARSLESTMPAELPTSRNELTRVAEELAARVHGRVTHVIYSERKMGFGIEEASQKEVTSELVRDPRIASIAAVIAASTLSP